MCGVLFEGIPLRSAWLKAHRFENFVCDVVGQSFPQTSKTVNMYWGRSSNWLGR